MPVPVQLFYNGVTTLNRVIFSLSSLLMFLIVPMMLFAVISRYGFNAPSSWAMELAALIFGPYFLLTGPHLLHERAHVSLDLVQHAVGARVRRILDLLNYPVIMAFAVILLFYAVPFAAQSIEYGETSYSSWNPPIWPVKLFIPISLFLLALQAFAEWLRILLEPAAIADGSDDVEAAL